MPLKTKTKKQAGLSGIEILASGIPSRAIHAAILQNSSISQAFREAFGSRSLANSRLYAGSLVDRISAESSAGSLSNVGLLASALLAKNEIPEIAKATEAFRISHLMERALQGGSWQRQLAGLDSSIIGEITRQQSQLQKALMGLSSSLSGANELSAFGQLNLSPQLQAAMNSSGYLGLTNKRLAALAGITKAYGFGDLHRQSTETLLGSWQTKLGLPDAYWHDPRHRRSLYQEANVDSGLIEANTDTAIELCISSGAIEGEVIYEGRYVVGKTATGLLTLTSSNLATDTFELVGSIETALRKLISSKLSEVAGPKWFRQRVPGSHVKRANEAHQRARMAGEAKAQLIEFLTLGDLLDIVLRADNWEGVFEPIFRSREWFKRDIEVIGFARNANAHYRPNDGLRLAEVMIVWQRLKSFIEDNGRWKQGRNPDQ